MNSTTDTAQSGTKRKREAPVLTEEDIAAKIAGKLHHNLKELRKAAKKAKSFENQRTVKKIKGLKTKPVGNELADCEAQLEILKTINHEHIAHTAIKTKLLKDKRLSENAHVKAAMDIELAADSLLEPTAAGSNEARVQSRLFSSKILAAEAAAILVDLRNVLWPEKKVEAEEIAERPKKVKKVEDVKVDLSKLVAPSGSGSEDSDEEENVVEGTGWESGTVDGEGGREDDGWESGSIDGEGMGGSVSSSEDEDSDDEELKPTKLKPAAKAKPEATKSKAKSGESTFLPSLAVGFTRGGSDDSDFSEDEAAQPEVKKNRRGQRARQAIWEKKYGGGANHVKKNKEQEAIAIKNGVPPAAAAGRPQRGSQRGPPGKQPVAPPAAGKDGGWGQRARPTAAPGAPAPSYTPARTPLSAAPYVPAARAGPPPKKTETSGLHPSWEAKKKMKEKMSAGIVPSQGTKIKF